jgi:hypothetical protein
MSSTFYPKAKENLLKGNIDVVNDTVKIAMVDTGTYTYSSTHELYSDLSGVVGTPTTLANVALDVNSIGGDNVTFDSVTGSTVEAVVIYKDSGTPATSYLIAYIDTITNSPIVPNGGDLTVVWDDATAIATL